ncbi:hypothetical protein [Natronomonas gomsonensis]
MRFRNTPARRCPRC